MEVTNILREGNLDMFDTCEKKDEMKWINVLEWSETCEINLD